MAEKILGLSKKDFKLTFLSIPDLHLIFRQVHNKIFSLLETPIIKADSGPILFECIKIFKDGSSKIDYDFIAPDLRKWFEISYEKGFYFNQVKMFEALFDKRKTFGNDLIEHALFLVLAENPSYLSELKQSQLGKMLIVMKNVFFTPDRDIELDEIELSPYHINTKVFERLKKNTIESYLSCFTDEEFTKLYTYAFGFKSTDILEGQIQAYEVYKNHISQMSEIFKTQPNKIYWMLKSKLLPRVLKDNVYFETPYLANEQNLKYFMDEYCFNAFLDEKQEVLDQISIFPKSDDADVFSTLKRTLVEHIFATYSIFNLQTYYLAHSKFKGTLNPLMFKICFSTKFFIAKKMYESKFLKVDPMKATKAFDLIYEGMLQFSNETILQINMLSNGDKSRSPDPKAVEFVEQVKLLEAFICDNQFFNGNPSNISNLNLVDNIYTYSDFLAIANDWFEMKQKLRKLQTWDYKKIDLSQFSEHFNLLGMEFYQRPRSKTIFGDFGEPEHLKSFVFTGRTSLQKLVFYIKIDRIFDQYIVDAIRTPTGDSVRGDEPNITHEFLNKLNTENIKFELNTTPSLSAV